MDKTNQELELYKTITEISEYGWHSDTEFFVFPYLFELKEFIDSITDVFGKWMFDDGGVTAHIMDGYVCINLVDMLSGADIDLERVFPKEEYKH